jgi:glycosyltransferase involved in cell wall biosynthesis
VAQRAADRPSTLRYYEELGLVASSTRAGGRRQYEEDEAMMLGMPLVALATTEMSTVVENGVSGWIDTDVDRLMAHMHRLLADRDEAHELAAGARRTALARFSIDRFAADWDEVFRLRCRRAA